VRTTGACPLARRASLTSSSSSSAEVSIVSTPSIAPDGGGDVFAADRAVEAVKGTEDARFTRHSGSTRRLVMRWIVSIASTSSGLAIATAILPSDTLTAQRGGPCHVLGHHLEHAFVDGVLAELDVSDVQLQGPRFGDVVVGGPSGSYQYLS